MNEKYSNLLFFLLAYPDNVDDIKDERFFTLALMTSKEPYKRRLLEARKEYLEYTKEMND